MDLRKSIVNHIKKHGSAKTSDITKTSGLSRVYVNRFFQELRKDGKIILIGKANNAHYVLAEKEKVLSAKKNILSVSKMLDNKRLSEDFILDGIKNSTGIFFGLSTNLSSILDYAFTEMLNNAIDHSRSRKIGVKIKRDDKNIKFEIIDRGIGIFNNIIIIKKLNSEMDAIQDLLKGKQTTAPEAHSGEGIFFTSKSADNFTIESSTKKLIFNNIIGDVFINDIKKLKGTRVTFVISVKTKRRLLNIFKEYSGDSLAFDKTNVLVKLYKIGTDYVSRSQARRIMSGLEKFKTITLDFKKVDTVGQAFADEVYRIWQSHHPSIEIINKNINQNIDFMIKRSMAK